MTDQDSMPSILREPLTLLSGFTAAEFDALQVELESDVFAPRRRALAQRVAERLDGVTAQRLEDLFGVLTGLVAAGQKSNTDPENVADGLTRAPGLDIDPQVAQELRRRLIALLSSPALVRLSKAYRLEREHGPTMVDSSLTSDARPIYGEDRKQPPDGFHIWHTLGVTFENPPGSKRRSATFALDYRDLLRLKQQVDIALDKQRSLQDMFVKQGFGIWHPLEDK